MTFEVCGALVQQPFDLNISAGCTSLHACDWESEQLRTSISTKRQTVFASGRCWIRWKLFLLCIIIWCNVNLGLLLQYYYYHLINLICCLMLLFEFNFKSFPPRRGYEFNLKKFPIRKSFLPQDSRRRPPSERNSKVFTDGGSVEYRTSREILYDYVSASIVIN